MRRCLLDRRDASFLCPIVRYIGRHDSVCLAGQVVAFLLVNRSSTMYGYARMKHIVLAFLVVHTAVAHADDCESVVAKSRPVLDALAKEDGLRAFTPTEYQHAVARCRRDAEPPLRDALACVRAAKDQAATRACWQHVSVSYGSDTYGAVIRVEGEFQLDRMRSILIIYFNSMGSFPKRGGELLPAGAPCCKRPGTTCPEFHWEDIPWSQDLDFTGALGPTLFQYSYASDGHTVTATAVGDIECDGTPETYTLKMSVKRNKPVWKLLAPKKTSKAATKTK